ncbi:hypothetical protein ND856_09875 [Leptospira bandrabouensis]|uniref:hypothetical protein n=1 Tax=Leptospira bandrabouensis TaxID=2484903 RepID=UPI00223D900B|nr:hypothetical protein [Leptospira bandrabouensis]MCW7457669.1 hypothetical protein [Leptospira bandrabouensis]MCW7477591.1 hypothetical protein [Leptospira bandrabouensis]MCW7485273.1 hypothetical protein [Leptospira bandrabouensis]
MKSTIFLTLLVLMFGIDRCSSLLISEEEQSKVTIQNLREKGYRFRNSSSSEKGAVPNSITQFRNIYQAGDFERICSLQQIRNIRFESTLVPVFTAKETSICSQLELGTLGMVDVTMTREAFCKVTETFSKTLNDFYIGGYISGLTEEMTPCIAKLSNIKSLSIGYGKAKATKETFCNTLRELKNISLLTIDNTDLPSNSLNCILELPNLKRIWLFNWRKVSYDDRASLIREYEKKYNRKIESNIVDDY